MCSCPVFPAPLIEETVFSPLYILASFIIDQLTLGVWIYLWAFYPVPLIYISVFVPVPYCLDYCSFVVQSEVRESDSSSSVFFTLKTALAIPGLLCLHTNFKILCLHAVNSFFVLFNMIYPGDLSILLHRKRPYSLYSCTIFFCMQLSSFPSTTY